MQTRTADDGAFVMEWPHTLESSDEGVFTCSTQTRYNVEGQPLSSIQKQLISQLSATLAEKVITINERGLTSADWTVYNNGTKRTRYSSAQDSASPPHLHSIRTAYTPPYAEANSSGDVERPIQKSCEYLTPETA